MASVDARAPPQCTSEGEYKGAWWTSPAHDNWATSSTLAAEVHPWSGVVTALGGSAGPFEGGHGSPEGQVLSPAILSWTPGRRGVKYASMNDFAHLTEIYRGRLSVVWRAVCGATAQEVVVKGYPKAYLRDRHLLNVRKEVAFLQRFTTDGFRSVISLLGVFEDAHNVCIVTEYCHGHDLLHQMNKSGGTLSERDVCRKVVYPLLKVLVWLHKQGIVHRDIKAENVFFTKDDSLKLGDFGLALDMTQEIATTKVGTLDYMAPEVIRMPARYKLTMQDIVTDKLGFYDEKIDVWSLGILTYELIVGRPPFEVEDMQETMRLILWSPVDKFPTSMSVFCQHFIGQALQKDVQDRPSAEELLQHPWICQNMGIRALAPPSPVATPRCESIASDQSRPCSPPPPCPLSGKLQEQKSPPLAGSTLKPSNRLKTCLPRLEGSQAGKLSKKSSGLKPKLTLWSCTGGPAKLYGVESAASSKKDSIRSGRFKFDPRNLTNRGHAWINSRFAKKRSSAGVEPGCTENAKSWGESLSFSGKPIKERIKNLLPKKLRSKKNLT